MFTIRGAIRLLLVCLATVLLLPTAAYADETEEANRLVDEAVSLLKQDTAQYQQVVDLIFKAGAIDPATKQAADALPLLDQAEMTLGALNARMQSVVGILDKAAALDLGHDYQTYLRQEKGLMQVNLELYAVLGELIANERTAYAEWDTSSRSRRDELSATVTTLIDQASALETQTEEKGAAAQQYFVDNRLGEATQGQSNTRFWVPGVLFFAALGLAIGWYRRRRRHQGPASPKSLDEEMRGV
jgi:hypothetical protein